MHLAPAVQWRPAKAASATPRSTYSAARALFDYIQRFHTHPGAANRVVDLVVAGAIEFKAFALFSLLFGAGTAIQAGRAQERGVNASLFLVRRFLVLLAFGLCHLLLI